MPAAAVIPAPIAYIKVVAVKKLVVEFLGSGGGLPSGWYCCGAPFARRLLVPLTVVRVGFGTFTLKKLECSKQAYA